MSTTTIAKPAAGQQVRIIAMPGGYQNGSIGTVSDAYTGLTERQIAVKVEETDAPAHQNGCWIVDEWETIYPAVGDKVIPLPDNGNWYGIREEYRNAVGTVSEVSGVVDGQGRRYIVAEFQSHQKPDDTERWSFYWCKPAVTLADVMDGHTLTVSSDEGRAAAMQEQIDTLTRELARANERVEELRTRAGKWERDFMRYAERVLQEAVDRDWCHQYEEVVDDIRGNLEIATIPDREVEVDIYWDETYTVTVRRHASVTLTAGYDSDDIDNAARERNSDCDADTSEVIDAVRNGTYSSEEYVDGSAREGY